MAIKTTLAQIEEVQAAITKVMSAQQASSDGKNLMRAQLSALTARESMLLQRYYKETGSGGPKINIGVPRRDY